MVTRTASSGSRDAAALVMFSAHDDGAGCSGPAGAVQEPWRREDIAPRPPLSTRVPQAARLVAQAALPFQPHPRSPPSSSPPSSSPPSPPMCQDVRRYGCGHVQKRLAVCRKASSSRHAAAAQPGGLVQSILDFLFPSNDAGFICTDVVRQVRPSRGPCPACARSRRHGLAPADGKPLPHLPVTPRPTREASQRAPAADPRKGKITKKPDVAPPLAGRPRPVTRSGWHHEPPSPLSRHAPLQPEVRDRSAKPKPAKSRPVKSRPARPRPADSSFGSGMSSHGSPVMGRPKPNTASAKRDSVGGHKSALNRWRFDHLLKSRYRGSVDSDKSFVSPAARRIENGETDVWIRPPRDMDEKTLWI